ncbi:peptidase A4 family-domain-containing protein [Mycena maculata]|uniref:Peptidase A4 family-domain-containing protein n=1 Tax=Mycena maculata TaxID=230809 RepID=A0AAD7HVV6_9AGAR|nr:peptidase A4 family-domain-containing protein [Mycena maculata]
MFATLLTYALFATAAFAHPSPGLNGRLARRAEARQSGPRLPSNGPASLSNITNAEYSSNWAGAAFESPALILTIFPSGTFVVPTPKAPSGGGSGSFAASAWVGIDGDTCGTAILQTGIDFTVDVGRVSYDAWFEYLRPTSPRSRPKIAAGNTIKLIATVSSATSGTVVIENVSTGVTVFKALTSAARLCQENAEWIVEDFEEGNSLVPFANFGTVTFSNAVATTVSGSTVGPTGAVIIDLEQNSQVLTSASTSSTAVTATECALTPRAFVCALRRTNYIELD